MGIVGDSTDRLRALWERNPLDTPDRPRVEKSKPIYVLGLDLGQTHDYSALVLDEISRAGEPVSGHDVRYIKRWPLKTTYHQIVREVSEMTYRAPLSSTDTLVVDMTGVGRGVVDQFRTTALGVQLVPLTITAGHQITQVDDEWHVPKKELIGIVTVLLQSGRMKIAPALPEAATLLKELGTFQMKISLAANDIYGAWREGQNDDTVLATAMACWYGERCSSGAGVWFA